MPGLTVLIRQNYAQDLQLSIRGFGPRSAFGILGIRLLIDGIPATTPDGQGQGSSITLASTERIEVLRGPQALMYGNSSGGVIQSFTCDAPVVPELGVQYYAGSYGMHRNDVQYAGRVGGEAAHLADHVLQRIEDVYRVLITISRYSLGRTIAPSSARLNCCTSRIRSAANASSRAAPTALNAFCTGP